MNSTFPYQRVSFLTMLLVILLLPAASRAQFIKGYGLYGGAHLSRQLWKTDVLQPPKRTGLWKAGANAAFFMEMGNHEYLRWQSEIQWMPKNTRLVGLPTRLGYLNWGNYLKLRQELYDVTPYLLAGVKAEYPYAGPPGAKLTATLSVGLGMEILLWRPWIVITELGYDYNPIDAVQTDTYRASTRAFWLRFGLKREVARRSKSCFPSGPPPMIQ